MKCCKWKEKSNDCKYPLFSSVVGKEGFGETGTAAKHDVNSVISSYEVCIDICVYMYW